MQRKNMNQTLDLKSGMVDEQHQLEAPRGTKFYWRKVRKFVFILFGLEASVLLLSLVKVLRPVTNEILPSLIFMAEILVMVGLLIIFFLKKDIKGAWRAVALFGLVTGILAAVLRTVWYFQVWTVLNLFLEPIVSVFWAAALWLVGWIIYKIILKIQAIVFYHKSKIRSDLLINK